MKAARDYRHTVVERARRDSRFRTGLLKNAVTALQTNELQVSKDMLRNYVEATGGLSALSEKCQASEKRPSRMLSPQSNPKVTDFFSLLAVLLNDAELRLTLVRSRTL